MQAPVPSPNQINSYEQLLRLYHYTRAQSQANNTAVKVLHNKLVELVKNIIDNSPKTNQTASQLKGQLTARVKELKENLVLGQNDTTDFNTQALRISLVQVFVDKNNEKPSSAEFIKFLDDACEEAGTSIPVAPRDPLEILAERNGIHIPTAVEKATGNYRYNMGQFGSTSKHLRYVLEGIAYDRELEEARACEGPDDADDLSRCVFYVDSYLASKNRTSLNEEEKQKISAISRNWAGIAEHWDELSQAIHNNMPFAPAKALLHECMNGAKNVYGEDEAKQVSPAENAAIIEFLRKLTYERYTEYDLKGTSRIFANKLINTIHTAGYYIDYHYENKGMTHGTFPLSRGRAISFLNKADFSYIDKKLVFRPRTAADDVDSTITKVSKYGIQISF